MRKLKIKAEGSILGSCGLLAPFICGDLLHVARKLSNKDINYSGLVCLFYIPLIVVLNSRYSLVLISKLSNFWLKIRVACYKVSHYNHQIELSLLTTVCFRTSKKQLLRLCRLVINSFSLNQIEKIVDVTVRFLSMSSKLLEEVKITVSSAWSMIKVHIYLFIP